MRRGKLRVGGADGGSGSPIGTAASDVHSMKWEFKKKKKKKKKCRSCGRPSGGILPTESKGVSEPITMCRRPFPSSLSMSNTVAGQETGWWGEQGVNKRPGNQSNHRALIPACPPTPTHPPTPPPTLDYLHFSHAIAVAPFAQSLQYCILIYCVLLTQSYKKTSLSSSTDETLTRGGGCQPSFH